MSAPKLTKPQRAILLRMAQGWALGQSTSSWVGGGCWLQRDGVGKGGEIERANTNSVSALQSAGYLRAAKGEQFPTRTLELTKAGRAVAAALLPERITDTTDHSEGVL